jgi:hypothetical protein
MGQCACTESSGSTQPTETRITSASPNSSAPNNSIASTHRSSPSTSQRSVARFDAEEGSKAIWNALDVASGTPSTLQTVPCTVRHPPPQQQIESVTENSNSGTTSIAGKDASSQAGPAPLVAAGLAQLASSPSAILRQEVEAFCRLVLSNQRSAASMKGLIDAVELSMKCRRPTNEMEPLSDNANLEDLTVDVLEHHSAVYSVLFSLIKSGDFVSDRKKLLSKRSGASPTSPPTNTFGSTRTFRQTSERTIVDEGGPADATLADHTSNIFTAVHISKSLLSHYFLRPIGTVVCLAAQRSSIPHDYDGWGLLGRSMNVPAALMLHQQPHQRNALHDDHPLSLSKDPRESSPPMVSCRESQSTSRCTSPSQFRNTLHLAHSSSGQMSLTLGGAEEFHSDDVVPEDELFARLHQWAVAAHRRRRRLSRSDVMEESSLEDVDALVGLAGKGYRCKEPTNEEREERLFRGVAKARLSGVIETGGEGRHRSASSNTKPPQRHSLGQVDALGGSSEQEQCLRYPSQAQQRLLFSPAESAKGSPSIAAAPAAAVPESLIPLLQRQTTTDSSSGIVEGELHEETSLGVEDVHMSVFLPHEALDEQKSLTSSPHKNADLVGQPMQTPQRTKCEPGSELPSVSGGTLLPSHLSMSLHGNTSSSAEDKWEAAMCLEAHQFSRTGGWDSSNSVDVDGSASRVHHMIRSEPQHLALIGLAAQRGVLMHACCAAISAAASAYHEGAGEAMLTACFQRAKAAIPTTILPTTAHLVLPDHLDAPQSPRAPAGTAEAICSLPPIGFDVLAPLCGSLPNTYTRLLLLPCITPALEHSDIPAGLRMLLMYSGLLCLPLRHPSHHSSRKGNSPHPFASGGGSSLNQSGSRARWFKNSGSSAVVGGSVAAANQRQQAVVSASSSAVGSGTHEHGTPHRTSAHQPQAGGLSRSSMCSSGTATSSSWPSPSVDSAMHWHRDEDLLFWLIVQWRTNSEPEPIIETASITQQRKKE